ncbi:MAG TPA: hypothetical protein VE029_00835 [Rhizobacter sp.]|nr:hypothetical protein [Rhizobacter sp.]
MDTREHKVGDFRICAKAIDTPLGGFVAGVALYRLDAAAGSAELVHSEDGLFRGHVFADAHAALVRAMDVGHQLLRSLAVVA